MFNIIYARNGGPPKTTVCKNRIALVEFILTQSPAYVNINGMDLDWETLKKNKKVSRYLKLRKLKYLSK